MLSCDLMNGIGIKYNQKGALAANVYWRIQKMYSPIARKLTHIVKPKPIKISRFGKTFFVSGNLEYFLFWKYKFWEPHTHKIFDKYLDSNFFMNPVEDTKKVIEVLKIYKNIYSDKGKKIELYDLLSQKNI